MTGWEMYWLLMLDSINKLSFTLFSLCFCGAVFAFGFGFSAAHDARWYQIREYRTELIPEKRKIAARYRRGGIAISIFSLIFLIICTFTPTTKQMAAIMVVPKIVNNEQIQQLPEKLLGLGLEWLDELKPSSMNKEEI